MRSATEFPCLLMMESMHVFQAKGAIPPQYVAGGGRHSGFIPLTRESGRRPACKVVARFQFGKTEQKESTGLLIRLEQTDNLCATSRRVLRGIIAPVLRRESANQATDSVMRRLRTPKDVCSFTPIPPLHPHRLADFRRHRQLVVPLLALGQRFGILSEPQTRAFRSNSVHQQSRIHSMARLTHGVVRIPRDEEGCLLVRRNRQQSLPFDLQSPTLRRLRASRAAKASNESRE